MKLKLDANGNAVLQDGKPVYIHDDGKEVAFDAPGTVATISRLNGEAKSHREAKEAAEEQLKKFAGISDVSAALKALETVKNLDDKKLVDAGEVERVKAEAVKAWEEKFAGASKAHSEELGKITKERDTIRSEYHNSLIANTFSGSKFISDKFAIPADLVQARFGSQFKVEDGKIVAYDASGNKVFSRTKPGNLAEFDEALEIMVDAYPHRDSILKDVGGGGGAREPGKGGGNKTMRRSEYDKLDPMQQRARIKEGFKLVE